MDIVSENEILRTALIKITEGRGLVADHSTVYMDGKNQIVPKVFNARDMQEIAQDALIKAGEK